MSNTAKTHTVPGAGGITTPPGPSLPDTMPRVVHVSGGRSSGMMLLEALRRGELSADRGDVCLFQNTGAEHPETYEFVGRLKARAEAHGMPFFVTEFCTYEHLEGKVWCRFPGYRITTPEHADRTGAVFEDFLSWVGRTPTIMQRICTQNLKIESARRFMRDWFGGGSEAPAIGHMGPPQLDIVALHERHQKRRGLMALDDFARRKEFVMTRPPGREAQPFSAYTAGDVGRRAMRHDQHQPYVTFIGLRADEPRRVTRLRLRNQGKAEPCGGTSTITHNKLEWARCPLAEWGVTKPDVSEFWVRPDNAPDDLRLPTGGHLGNCVFCFMKRPAQLALAVKSTACAPPDTPQSVHWWARMEKKYSRKVINPRRGRSGYGLSMGFFGIDFSDPVEKAPPTYSAIADDGISALGQGTALDLGDDLPPCECTD